MGLPSKFKNLLNKKVKKSNKGLQIGQEVYKSPKDLEKPSIEALDAISKTVLTDGKELVEQYNESLEENKKKLKSNPKLLKKFKNKYNDNVLDGIYREFYNNSKIGFQGLKKELEDSWQSFIKQKSKNKEIFKDAKSSNGQIIKKINDGTTGGKEDCAVTISLKALIKTPQDANKFLEDHRKSMNKKIKDMEKFTEDLIESESKNSSKPSNTASSGAGILKQQGDRLKKIKLKKINEKKG